MMYHIPMHVEVMTFLTAFVFPMFGQGGGTVYVPTLLVNGYQFTEAVYISQLLIVGSVVGFILFAGRWQSVSLKLLLTVEPPTLIGALIGGYVANKLPFPEYVLRLLFYLLVVLMAISMLVKFFCEREKISVNDITSNKTSAFWIKLKFVVGVFLMFLAGLCAAVMGIGGGLLKVPAMIIFLGVNPSIATGTSSLMVGVTAFFSFLGRLIGGSFFYSWHLFFLIVIAVIAGVFSGLLSEKITKNSVLVFRNILLPFMLLAISLIGIMSCFGM